MTKTREYTLEELMEATIVTPDMMLQQKRCVVKKNTVSQEYLKKKEVEKHIDQMDYEVIRE